MSASSMFCLYLTLVVMVTTVFGCSPPIGGFVPPTPARRAHYSEHVLVGEVTSILAVDPIFGNMDSTYGATVNVLCSYKGGVLPGTITIGAAGVIPGHCTSKHLVLGTKYVIFLSAARVTETGTFYEQAQTAQPAVTITNYLNVCALKMVYRKETGYPLALCPHEQKGGNCKWFDPKTGETRTKMAASTTQ